MYIRFILAIYLEEKAKFPKFNLKVLECDIRKVFETYKPVKVLSFYDNAKRSACDLVSTISSVLILQLFHPDSQCGRACVCERESLSVSVLMHMHVCE